MCGRLIVAIMLLAAVGCTSDQSSDDADDRSGEAGSTTATVTTQPMNTSVPSSSAPATTAVPASPSTPTPVLTSTMESEGLVLTAQGIGEVAFGTSKADALTVMQDTLGAVASDSWYSYPIDRGDGTYLADGEAFAHPERHTACFDNALCIVFGGASIDALAFVGWEQHVVGADPLLTTVDGVAVGSVWADHLDDLDVDDWGCYSDGYATTRDMRVGLHSAGDPFLAYDDDGNQIPTEPDPVDVTITYLSAGSIPSYPEWDC